MSCVLCLQVLNTQDTMFAHMRACWEGSFGRARRVSSTPAFMCLCYTRIKHHNIIFQSLTSGPSFFFLSLMKVYFFKKGLFLRGHSDMLPGKTTGVMNDINDDWGHGCAC